MDPRRVERGEFFLLAGLLPCGVWMHYPSSQPKGEAISHSLGVQSRRAAAASESSLERHTHDCRRHHFEITLSLLTLSFLSNSEEPYSLLFSLVPQNNRNLLVCVYQMLCKMFRNAHNIIFNIEHAIKSIGPTSHSGRWIKKKKKS